MINRIISLDNMIGLFYQLNCKKGFCSFVYFSIDRPGQDAGLYEEIFQEELYGKLISKKK